MGVSSLEARLRASSAKHDAQPVHQNSSPLPTAVSVPGRTWGSESKVGSVCSRAGEVVAVLAERDEGL